MVEKLDFEVGDAVILSDLYRRVVNNNSMLVTREKKGYTFTVVAIKEPDSELPNCSITNRCWPTVTVGCSNGTTMHGWLGWVFSSGVGPW